VHASAQVVAGEGGWLPSVTNRLDRPLSGWVCVLGWVASTALFVALLATFAGPSNVDSTESLYSTWAIAHGQIACAYPSASSPVRSRFPQPPIPPVYPLLSGGIAAVAQIGHSQPFPSARALGPDCDHVDGALQAWSVRSGALSPTLWIGCAAWLALMAGVIAWLRVCGRGRSGWEPVTLVVVALLLPVWMTVQSVFHPQDLLALGFALVAMACSMRGRWVAAGVFCALAILSQQFALLVAVPLFVLAPPPARVRFAGAGLLTAAIPVVPLAILTSGNVLHAIALGSGDNPGVGGTVLWELHPNGTGPGAVLLFRVAPLAVSLVLSWWVARRLGRGALNAMPLLSLVAVSLGLRLVFEVSLWTYYYLALAVCLVLLEATRGTIRRWVVAWFAVLTLLICRMSIFPFGVNRWGVYLENDVLPLCIGGLALVGVLLQLSRGADRRNLWPWVAIGAVDLLTRLPGNNSFAAGDVVWFWQVIIVVPGVLLAAAPLRWSFQKPVVTETGVAEPALSPGS